jgi:hypothetical protein
VSIEYFLSFVRRAGGGEENLLPGRRGLGLKMAFDDTKLN